MSEITNRQQLAATPKRIRVRRPAPGRIKRLPPVDDNQGLTVPAQPQAQQRLKSEWVQLRLKQLPGWQLQSGGKALDRMREFPDQAVTASYLAFATMLARQMGQTLRAAMNGTRLYMVLAGPATWGGRGITEEVLELAEQLG